MDHEGSTNPLRILFSTAEIYPFAKIGGLADVSGALPKELTRLGHEVRVVIPAYAGLTGDPLVTLEVEMGEVTEQVTVSRLAWLDGVRVLTIGAAGWFERRTPYGYQDEDVLPFVLFGKAVAALAADPAWRPDVIHANEWHSGLVAQELREGAHRERMQDVAVVFTIHNIAYQGMVGAATDRVIGLPPAGSLMARGITFADQVSTVSPHYRDEILTPAYSHGMHEVLGGRRADLRGILNGVDYAEFSPERDPWIDERYDGTFIVGKRQNKRILQKIARTDLSPRRPLIGMVARLVQQKGVGLVCRAADELSARGCQVIVMGEGEPQYRRALRSAQARHPRDVAYLATNDEVLARRVYAGADLFLAPSAFEPCGLTPLISLRYGTIPVVRRTGGMVDTILDYHDDPDHGLGFTFGPRRVTSLLEAVDRALAVYHRGEEWNHLQRRAMAADFSWQGPAREYVEMYRAALRRRAPVTVPVRIPEQRPRPRALPLPLALVHHANQYLIADAYTDREGLSALIDGYAALLRLHDRYRVPAHLHLSGTLIEAAAWWRPEFLAEVRRLQQRRLVTLIGGTYSESVLTAFSPDFNRRQLAKLFWLYEQHLGCAPEDLQICWVPERVWKTEQLAPQLTDPTLPNGGYRYVLLDDRLLYPTGGEYHGSDRELFDLADRSSPPPADACRVYRIAGGHGLHALPISTRLRYWVPPVDRQHWASLARTADMSVAPGDDAVLVYADDMEKTAGVGPWERSHLDAYEAFLRWLTTQTNVVPVSLVAWLGEHRRPAAERELEPGTFVELARDWQADEDYAGWAAAAAWVPYREYLARSEAVIRAAEGEGVKGSLLDLAWKHLLASGYETGWRDVERADRAPAAWAKALASHARSSIVITTAARWFGQPHTGATAELVDIDGDGEPELVLANASLYAVLTPQHGGRIVYLACGTPTGGALVVGNPSDDWNWQESLNRFMDQPANHPGALADVGAEHDRFEARMVAVEDGMVVELRDVEEDSPWSGLTKRLYLATDASVIAVEYELPRGTPPVEVNLCLSPDYYRLLRMGRGALQPFDGPGWRGMRSGDVQVWVALEGDSDRSAWVESHLGEVGHGEVVAARGAGVFRLLLGVGPTTSTAQAEQMRAARRAFAQTCLTASGAQERPWNG